LLITSPSAKGILTMTWMLMDGMHQNLKPTLEGLVYVRLHVKDLVSVCPHVRFVQTAVPVISTVRITL